MKNMLITGANRGIGLGFTRHYLMAGARVFATCRTPAAAQELHTLQPEFGERLVIVECDVTNEASLDAAAATVTAQTAALDVLINNAGIFVPGNSLGELTARGLAESFAVNTIAPMMVIQHFAPLLTGGDVPRLVNITMPTRPIANLDTPRNHHYVASRYALNALTKMVALELASQGIITVALWPGYLRTDMNNHDEKATPVEQGIPLAAGVIDNLTADDNGGCFLPDGRRFEW